MAQAQVNFPHPRNNVKDGNCRYDIFESKPEGNVHCLAIGKLEDDRRGLTRGPVVGITFQNASIACIKSVLPDEVFFPVEWENDPSNFQDKVFIDLDDPALAPVHLPRTWMDFASTMSFTRQILLQRMANQNAATLLDAFQNAAPRDRIPITDIKNARGPNWTDNTHITMWAKQLTKGCIGTPSHELSNVLGVLFSGLVDEVNEFKIPPQETSKNYTIEEGVPHCLNYGYDQDQQNIYNKLMKKNGDENDELDQRSRRRGRETMRILLAKRDDSRGKNRSRSRSPVRQAGDEFVEDNSVNIRRHQDPIAWDDLMNNPDDYLLNSSSFYKFFEPHKPDLAAIFQEGAGDQFVAKVVCKLASWHKHRSNITLQKLVELETEQCVQSCLAALAHEQKSILGLIVIVDGFKVIKIERNVVDGDGRFIYNVRETDLVSWDEVQHLYVLLEMMRIALIS